MSEASLGVLHPVLGTVHKERYGQIRKSLAENNKNDQRSDDMQGKVGKPRII